jgi:uncharacterized delta-60 repeat protein
MSRKITRRLTPFALLLVVSCSAKEASNPDPTSPQPEPEEAEFELRVANTKVPVLQGASEEITVELVRKGEFRGPVHVEALELPDGASVTPGTIEADADTITLEVRADDDAPHSLPTAVELVGTADELVRSVELTVTVCGRPGALDTSFQVARGVVSVGAGEDYANALAVTSEGKVVVAGSSAENRGDIALIRLERDGRLDTSFGERGKVMTSLGSGTDVAHAVALQKDGKIVVAGATTGTATGLDFVIVRYLDDGTLDPSFGDRGKTSVALSNDSDAAYALLVQEDGRIVAAGSANQGATMSGVDFALVRLEADGSLDESFGDGGRVLTPVGDGSASDVIHAIVSQQVDGEERLVAAGGEGDFAVARYTTDGALDPSFGKGGLVSGVFGSVIGAAHAVTTTHDERILVAGHHGHDFALAQFDPSGRLDTAFGDDGTLVTAISEDNWDEARGLSVEADGKIVVGGWVYEGSSSSGNFALVRYTAEGVLDDGFGERGLVITELAATGKNDVANALLLQTDPRVPTTRVLLAGSANDSNHDFAVTRYWR